MHEELYDLKEMLLHELEKYGSEEMTAGSLEVVDKLAHSIKNLCKIINESDGYSGADYDYNYSRRGQGRGGSRGARYSRRNSYNYSMDGGMVEELRELMEDAPNEKVKTEFRKFIKKIEQGM